MAPLGKITPPPYNTALVGQPTSSPEEFRSPPSARHVLTREPTRSHISSYQVPPGLKTFFCCFCLEHHTELILSLKYFIQVSIVLNNVL